MGKIPIDPSLTERSSLEEAQAYDTWCRAEVQASLVKNASSITHDQAVAEMRERIGLRERARNTR